MPTFGYTMTARDEIFSAVLEQLIRTGKFKLRDLPIRESEMATARRVLRVMEDLGWVARSSPNSSIWRVGHKGELLLNISPAKIEAAKE